MMMRPGDILGRIFFLLSQKSIIGIYPRSTRRTRIIGLFSLSHEQNKARFNYAVARKQRRNQFRRMLNGYFFSCLKARNLGGNLL